MNDLCGRGLTFGMDNNDQMVIVHKTLIAHDFCQTQSFLPFST